MSIRFGLRWVAIVAILAYSVLRFFVVQATLQRYGVNPWVFLAIDASSGVVYVLGIEQLVVAMQKRGKTDFSRTIVWGVVTALMFAAPYVYMYVAGQAMPPIVAIGIGVIVLLLCVNAVLTFRRRIHAKR